MRTRAAGAAMAGGPGFALHRRRWLPRGLRRGVIWIGLFALAAGCYGIAALNHPPSAQSFVSDVIDRAIAVSAALDLVVTDIQVEGRGTTDVATIMRALAAERGTPILAVSPSRAKQQLESLPWVRSAAIERRLPNTIFVRLVERRPLAVWQHGGKQDLIDSHGDVIPVKDLTPFARLPTVVGDDAGAHAAKLLDMLASEPELAARVTAAVRIDNRRWNLRIDGAIDVLLPEENPAAAWARLAALEQSSKLLKRDVQTVDMRLPDRLVLRVHAAPPTEAAPAKKPHAPEKST